MDGIPQETMDEGSELKIHVSWFFVTSRPTRVFILLINHRANQCIARKFFVYNSLDEYLIKKWHSKSQSKAFRIKHDNANGTGRAPAKCYSNN